MGKPTKKTEETDAQIEALAKDPFFAISLDMLCIAGTDGYFKKVNHSFETILGYSEAELLGRPFLDFIHPDDIESTIREIKSLDEGLPTVMFENRYLHKDGSIRWIQWNSVSPPGTDLIWAVARDITSSKEDAENLKQYAQTLEQRNQELRDTQKQLIQAEKMESLGRLAAGVAHEVKNPLSVLRMGLEFLSQLNLEAKNPDLAKVHRQMFESINQANSIIDGLINFSKQSQISPDPIEFSEFVDEAQQRMDSGRENDG